MTPLIGLSACAVMRHELIFHTPARYARVVAEACGGIPLLLPPLAGAMQDVLGHLNGLLLTGSPSNVHPSLYDGGETETPDFHDPARDATMLPLIRAAVVSGVPVLAICRGIQELNVALGGSLIQRVHAQAGRADHRGGPGEMADRYAPKHPVAVSGGLRAILGAKEIMVNSVHGQAIDRLAPGLAEEARAPDGTIEAVGMPGAPGFVLGVQWHPEWNFAANPHSVAIFAAFGEACRRHGTSNGKAP